MLLNRAQVTYETIKKKETGLDVPMLHAVKWRAVPKTPIYAPATTYAPLSRSSRELLVNLSPITLELILPYINC